MARKPERWTTRSYITDKTGGGETRCIKEDIFELTKQPDGSWQAVLVESHVIMPEEEQIACKRKMMENAGAVLSDYISNHPESSLPQGKCELMTLLS